MSGADEGAERVLGGEVDPPAVGRRLGDGARLLLFDTERRRLGDDPVHRG